MANKNFIHKSVLVMLMVIVMVGLNIPRAAYAETSEDIVSLNEKSTAIRNKYGITGEILHIQKGKDFTVVLTKEGVFHISNGKAKKYTFSGTIMDTATCYLSEQEVYVSPILKTGTGDTKTYVEYKINLETGKKEIATDYSKYMDDILFWEPDSITTFKDADNNKWFSAFYNFSTKYYELYRIDTKGNVRLVQEIKGAYNNTFRAYDDFRYDADNNVYFTSLSGNSNVTYVDAKGNKSKVLSVLTRVNESLKQTSFEVYGTIDDYEIGTAKDIWVLSGKKSLLHFDKNGKKLATIALTDGKDISIHSNGSVYVLDDNKVKLVYQNKLTTKYTLDTSYRYHELYWVAKNGFIAANENTFELLNEAVREVIVSDSAVKYRPYIVKDNKGNVTILSSNTYTQKDKDLKVYQIGSSGITFHNVTKELGDYNNAVGYDGTVYIPSKNKNELTVNYLKSDMTTGKYVTVISFLPFLDMQFDSKRNLYILDNQTLYKVNSAKKILSTDITDEKGGYNSQILGLLVDKYKNVYVKYKKQSDSLHNTYGLLKINDDFSIKKIEVTSGDRYADLIFVTAKNEVAMINADTVKGNQMYTLDAKGKSVRNTAYNGTSYYSSGAVSSLERIWKSSDGTNFYQGYLELAMKKPDSDRIWLGSIDQVMGDVNGGLFYTDYFNVYIYDKQLPKVTSTSPSVGQNKVSITSKVTLQINEPVKKGSDFSKISLTYGSTKISISCTLVDNKIIITPKSNLKSEVKYKVLIPAKAVSDIAGNTLTSDYTYTFTTK